MFHFFIFPLYPPCISYIIAWNDTLRYIGQAYYGFNADKSNHRGKRTLWTSSIDTLEKGAPDYFHFSTHRSQFLFFRFFFSLLFFARRLLSITELTINNYIIKVPNETDRLVSRTREASQRKPSITLQGSTTKSHQIK